MFSELKIPGEKTRTELEEAAKDHFARHVTRDTDGRYVCLQEKDRPNFVVGEWLRRKPRFINIRELCSGSLAVLFFWSDSGISFETGLRASAT
ncbi:hypothetical protein TNCV_2457381 [Trichonephila clavipes]|nr:hypothetical protein TNCV_2457381 [Trichonephila clavipes]